MESYQVVGIIMGIIGTLLGILMFLAGAISEDVAYLAVIGPFTGIFSFTGIFVALANPRYKRGVGVYYLVTGILFNLLLIVPAIMAFRWKPAATTTATVIGTGTISR
jgi:O-antigen/teichoic acid export membrane protein